LLGSLTSAMRGAFVSVGASGAIFGLFGGFAWFLLRHRKRLEPAAAQAALRNIGMLLAINLFIGLSVPGIDMAAHLGGLVGGAATAWALEQQPKPWSMLRRALVVGGCGAVALVGVSFVVPAGKPGAAMVLADVASDIDRALDRANQLLAARDAGTLTSAQAADGIEREVLPVWRAARLRLTDLDEGEALARVQRRLQREQEALVGLAAAVRADDVAAVRRQLEVFKRAE
jgi:rhomboid protease GluP